jgi:phenylacetate-CoA ligase
LDERCALLFELLLKCLDEKQPKKNTLVVVTYAMGVWIGGLITYQAFRLLGERGYDVTLITPGANKKEAINALVNLAPRYDQVILGGYPPFLKDVLDDAADAGFDASSCNMKLLMAAECFDEGFREHVMSRAGVTDPARGTSSVYGSADIGTMAIETPTSIALRRLALKNADFRAALIPDVSRLPTLAQFHPAVTDFEEVDGELLVSGDSALPLCRYALGDRGGVCDHDTAMRAVAEHAPGSLDSVAALDRPLPKLPFVHVYERTDFSVKCFGADIFAEYVREALQEPSLGRYITSKFSMHKRFDEHQDEMLEIHIELRPQVGPSDELTRRLSEVITAGISKRVTFVVSGARERILPQVRLWPYEHPDHFRPGGKQKWICRN